MKYVLKEIYFEIVEIRNKSERRRSRLGWAAVRISVCDNLNFQSSCMVFMKNISRLQKSETNLKVDETDSVERLFESVRDNLSFRSCYLVFTVRMYYAKLFCGYVLNGLSFGPIKLEFNNYNKIIFVQHF